jgi:hypothetical protein
VSTGPSTPASVIPRSSTSRAKPARVVPDPPVPAPLFAPGLSVRAGPVPVPVQLQIPSLGVNAQTLGVGVTAGDVMDAPEGPINDPVWEEAFWYRGSAVPGAVSTALIAGHVDGPRGTQGVFEHLDRLRPGDLVVVHDTRSALDVRFEVIGSMSFTLPQTTQRDVLEQIYGVGPVAGTTPQRAKDGLAHLTLISCAGTFQTGLGTHDHRLVVFANRVA